MIKLSPLIPVLWADFISRSQEYWKRTPILFVLYVCIQSSLNFVWWLHLTCKHDYTLGLVYIRRCFNHFLTLQNECFFLSDYLIDCFQTLHGEFCWEDEFQLCIIDAYSTYRYVISTKCVKHFYLSALREIIPTLAENKNNLVSFSWMLFERDCMLIASIRLAYWYEFCWQFSRSRVIEIN